MAAIPAAVSPSAAGRFVQFFARSTRAYYHSLGSGSTWLSKLKFWVTAATQWLGSRSSSGPFFVHEWPSIPGTQAAQSPGDRDRVAWTGQLDLSWSPSVQAVHSEAQSESESEDEEPTNRWYQDIWASFPGPNRFWCFCAVAWPLSKLFAR